LVCYPPLTRNGVPFAKIIKYKAPKVTVPGAWKGRIPYTTDWNSAETNAAIERLYAGTDDASAA
jgi:hypothetical protein